MKAGNGGKISVKMALNGNSKPSKVMNIEGPNEVHTIFLHIRIDFVIILILSKQIETFIFYFL